MYRVKKARLYFLFTLQHTFQGNREHQDHRDLQECRAVLEPKERYLNVYELVVN
jgi:hypothetical protein